MTRTAQFTAALTVTALLSASSAMAALVPPSTITFGNAPNDGYGGFTAGASTIVPTPAPGWALTADGAQFTNAPTTDSGQVNSSLLNEITLTRTPGSAYTITGVLDWDSTYAADNNRAGIMLFAATGDLAGVDSGISLQLNVGSGAFRILGGGVNGSTNLNTVTYNGLNGASAIGKIFTYQADIEFVGTDIEVDFTLIDENSFSQTISTTVVAADYLGEHFGFGTRGRVRYGTPGVNDIPFIYTAKSFSVAAIPEPASLAMLGLGGLAVLGRRRQA